MKPLNFELEDGIYISFVETLFDLHNDYDFSGFVKCKASIILSWKLGEGSWINLDQPKKVELIIEDVSKFEQVPGREDADKIDQVTLDEIAYLTDEEWCGGPFTTSLKPNLDWDWVFTFESDMWLIINAEIVSARI